MTEVMSYRAVKLAVVLVVALSIGACAKNPAEQNPTLANASARSPTARSARSRCATTFPAGRKTAVRLRCSTPAPERFDTGDGDNRRRLGAGCVFRVTLGARGA